MDLFVKRKDPDEDTAKPEARIDQLVYGLYNLTSDEIRMLEDPT